MTNSIDPGDLIGRTALDNDGDKIGKIGQVYLDDGSGDVRWVTVSTGLFGTKESFAPVAGARRDGDDLRLTVPKSVVKDAPNIDDDGHLNDDENDALYRYYADYIGTGGSPAARNTTPDVTPDAKPDVSPDVARGAGHDTSGPNTDDAMTRSEERLRVGTENVETGRARLRKYVVTEDVTQTVPVSHEEVRVEREPITDANRGDALDGPTLSEEEHEVTLHAERPVVDKETVPVERVRLGTETVADEQTVHERVRSEQIDGEQVDGEQIDTPGKGTR